MLSSFQIINAVFNPITIDMALSTALQMNTPRSHFVDIYHATREIKTEERREIGLIQAQIEAEAEAETPARIQANAHASMKNEAEARAKAQTKTQEEQEQRPASSQRQTRRYCRSRQARDRRAQARHFRETGCKQGRRKVTNVICNPVGCATLPPTSAVPLFHYFRHVPLSPSSVSSHRTPSSSPSSPTPSPLLPLTTFSTYSCRNGDAYAEQADQVKPLQRAKQLQELYKSQSAVHSHATALACGSRGVQPHRRVCAGGDNDRICSDSTSAAATIACAAAVRTCDRNGEGGTAPVTGSQKLNAAATPFVSNRNSGSEVADTQDAKNGLEFTGLNHGPFMPFKDHQIGYAGCYTYPSAWELVQACIPLHNITNTDLTSSEGNGNNNVDVKDLAQTRPRSRANPFPFSSASSSFTPSLPPASPSLATLSPLNSPLLPATPVTRSSTSKEYLSSFLAEEGDLLTLQLNHNLRRQHAEAELELALTQEQRRQQYETVRETYVLVIREYVRAMSKKVDRVEPERCGLGLSPGLGLVAERAVGLPRAEIEVEEKRRIEGRPEDAEELVLPPPALSLGTLE